MSQRDSRPPSALRRIGPLVRRWPFVTWAICALVMLVFLGAVGAAYDSFPLGILVITDGVWAWMYWAPSEVLFEFNGGIAVPHHHPISVVVGLFIAAVSDILLRTFRSRSARLGNT